MSLDDALPPPRCATMADVRGGVDAVDAALVTLLELRFAYMRAAARIKDSRDSVRDEPRKAEVLDRVRALAMDGGLPADEIVALWDRLIEASIAYELAEWDRLCG